jgi:hypothetical protein
LCCNHFDYYIYTSDNKDWKAYDELLDPRDNIQGREALASDIIKLKKQARKISESISPVNSFKI